MRPRSLLGTGEQSITIGSRQAWWYISKISTPAAEMGAVNLHFSEEMGVLATVLVYDTRGCARGGGTELVLTD